MYSLIWCAIYLPSCCTGLYYTVDVKMRIEFACIRYLSVRNYSLINTPVTQVLTSLINGEVGIQL